MTDETMHDRDGVLSVDLDTARAAAWAEHERRCDDNEPYTGGVTVGELVERVEGLRHRHSRVRQSGEDHALAVSSGEGPPSVDGSLDDADSAVGRELSWVAVDQWSSGSSMIGSQSVPNPSASISSASDARCPEVEDPIATKLSRHRKGETEAEC